VRLEDVASSLAETMTLVGEVTDESAQERSAMNFLVTNGEVMVATRRRRTLFISDGSRSAGGRSALFQQGAKLDQLIIASEALCGNHTAWNEVSEEEVVGVDGKLVLHRWRLSDLAVVG
jgi:hypothetical protein